MPTVVWWERQRQAISIKMRNCSSVLPSAVYCACGNKSYWILNSIVVISGNINAAFQMHTNTIAVNTLTSTTGPFFALSSLQKPCHYFIWTQLFSPLAPSVMTFLFQPEQKSHSPFSIVGWKLISSRGMSCHPLNFPSARSSTSICTYLEVNKKTSSRGSVKWFLFLLLPSLMIVSTRKLIAHSSLNLQMLKV